MKKILILLFLFCFLGAFAQNEKYSRVKIFCRSNELPALFSLGIPDEGIMKKDCWLITELSTNDIDKVRSAGFQAEVLIDDVAYYYSDRNINPGRYNESAKQVSCAVSTIVTPSHFVSGTMGGFYKYEEMLAQLDSMRVHYPNLISAKHQVGTLQSIEGRPLYEVKISINPDSSSNKPEVQYSALTHAREPMGMQGLIFYMWYLLENYGTDPEITGLINNTQMYFIPCVNVDGYMYNETMNPTGGGMWRKNRRLNSGGSYGVDLNRNYGYAWGYDNTGSSPNPTDLTYRGTAGFSEPETQIMKWFSEHRQFRTAIDYHTYGNDLVMPWCYINGNHTSDSSLYDTYSALMVQTNGYLAGTAYQTVGYTANGGSVDWFYGEDTTKGKIISWSPEAGDAADGFWPASNRIEDIAKVNIQQDLYVARFAGRYASVVDLNPRLISQMNDYFVFNIQRLGLDTAHFTVSLLPVTSNILSTGPSRVFGSLNVLETRKDSIAYALSPTIQQGAEVVFVVQVNNGLYVVNDTIKKVFGTPSIIFTDNCSNLSNWTAGGWGITTTQYYSAPSSITDSPSGNYGNNQNKSITLTGTVDLTNKVFAELEFRTKWSIEKGYDYVQLKASGDGGGTWTPLCGTYTHPGTGNQILNEPVYDGVQATWVKEKVDLTDYLGGSVKFMFTLVTDAATVDDGFYFDDMEVVAVNQSFTSVDESQKLTWISEPEPNPSGQTVTFQYNRLPVPNIYIEIYNELGQALLNMPLNAQKSVENIDVSRWTNGIYIAVFTDHLSEPVVRKIMIAH